MWMINPKILCKNHLLGEHNELHKHRHIFLKKRKIDGYINNNCIEPLSMEFRHNELVNEMESRGYSHNSPYKQPFVGYLSNYNKEYKINQKKSLKNLLNRCGECKRRWEGYIESCK
jgi:hypothetical protein